MLLVLERDSALQEIESFDEGILYIPASVLEPGDAVTVGQLLDYLLAEGKPPKSYPARRSRSA